MTPYDFAFPGTNPNGGAETGLTKREYIAAQIMALWFADKTVRGKVPSFNEMARTAIAAADALLLEASR